ncbi:hypothetical protein JW877_03745 [bacterium]|nr:hypothetical protein [bacterium]
MKQLIIIIICFLSLSFAQGDKSPTNAGAENDSIPASQIPHWDNISIRGFINKDSLPQNDTLIFTVELQLSGNPDDYSFLPLENPQVSRLNLISTSSKNRSEVKNGRTMMFKEYQFVYCPTSIGMAYINAVTLHYKYLPLDRDRTLQTMRLGVKVTDPHFPAKKAKWPWITGFSLLALIAICTILYVLLFHKDQKEAEVDQGIPFEMEIQTQLKESRNFLKSGDLGEYFDSISHLMRRFIAEKYDFDAQGMPTIELINRLKEMNINDLLREKVKKVLTTCDMVKFAKHLPSQMEIDEVYINLECCTTDSIEENKEALINIDNNTNK